VAAKAVIIRRIHRSTSSDSAVTIRRKPRSRSVGIHNEVTLSAYTQRITPATGRELDTYVYSARITRTGWATINFDNLPALDVVAAFELFDLRRKFAKNGKLESIVPLDTD
jgi:hypothetical protein